MTKTFTVHNAQISTATVEVNSLTISGKQVTLAVFRQLKQEDLVDEGRGVFVGVPWGTVNYCHSKVCNERDPRHLHVVWQEGDELRRSVVEPPRFDRTPWLEEGQDWLDAAVANGWTPTASRQRGRTDVCVEFPRMTISVDVDDTVRAAWFEPGEPPYRNDWAEREAERVREARDEALAKLRARTDSDLDVATGRVARAIDDELSRRDRMRALWAEVQALPQLFIAV